MVFRLLASPTLLRVRHLKQVTLHIGDVDVCRRHGALWIRVVDIQNWEAGCAFAESGCDCQRNASMDGCSSGNICWMICRMGFKTLSNIWCASVREQYNAYFKACPIRPGPLSNGMYYCQHKNGEGDASCTVFIANCKTSLSDFLPVDLAGAIS